MFSLAETVQEKLERREGVDQVTNISLAVLLTALLLPVLAHFLRAYPRWFGAAKYGILAGYAIVNLYETLLFREVQSTPSVEGRLFWSYRKSLAFPEGIMSLFNGTVEIVKPVLLESIVLNILLYVPLGYLLPFVFRKLRGWQVVLIAFLCSAVTEVTQFVFRIGLFEWDDMLNNTLGCVIGLLIYSCIVRCSRGIR